MQTYFRERNSTSMLGIGVQSKADSLFSATFCQPFKWNLSHAALIELFFNGNHNPLETAVGCYLDPYFGLLFPMKIINYTIRNKSKHLKTAPDL